MRTLVQGGWVIGFQLAGTMTARRIAVALLAVLGLLSVASLASTGIGYTRGMLSLHSLRVSLAGVQPRTGQDPALLISYRIENRSAEPLALDVLAFRIYLNDQFMGTSHHSLPGQELPANQETTLDFAFPLQPFYLRRLEQATASGRLLWSASTTLLVRPPQSSQPVRLTVRSQWRGN